MIRRSSALAWPDKFLLAVSGALFVRLLWVGAHNALDFSVYWTAAHDWWLGVNPYRWDVERAGFVFKYPPWILPLFIPFGPMPLSVAQVVWTGVQGISLVAIGAWCERSGLRTRAWLGTAILLWWIWLGHFYAGQLALLVCAVTLWSSRWERPEFAAWLLSAKGISIAVLAGFSKRAWNRRSVRWIARLVGVGAALAWARFPSGFDALFAQWLAAAQSGEQLLGWESTWGQGNHGWTALLVRLFAWGGARAGWIAPAVALTLTLMLGSGLWQWTRKIRDPRAAEIRIAAWLALMTVVSPLAWHHSFVMAYPLLAFAVDRARGRTLVLALTGVACVGLILPQTVGLAAVRPLELAGLKSWGVLLAWIALDRSLRRAHA